MVVRKNVLQITTLNDNTAKGKISTVLGVVLTTLIGYVLSRSNYKLKGFLTWVVFIPMIFNGGLVSSYYINSNFLGLKDSIWALITVTKTEMPSALKIIVFCFQRKVYASAEKIFGINL